MRGVIRGGSRQALVGALLTGVGAAALFIAPLLDKSAFVMGPGVEGCLTAGVVGFGLALLGGAGYLRTVAMALPIFIAQYLGCRAAGEAALATLGLESLMLGLVGIMTAPRPAAAREAVDGANRARAGRRQAAEIAVASASLRG